LSAGRDRPLVTVKGLNGAQITPAGVFHAVDLPGTGDARGIVSFLPLREVLRKLR
jgi:hypothetical protein